MTKTNKGTPSATPVIRRKPNLTIGERFKDARTEHNQNGKETTGAVAEATGVSKSTLSEIENDSRSPGAKIISDLARHYGVSADYLLGLSDVITLDATAQAAIAYTGLSEENVLTLHHMKESSCDSVLSVSNDGKSVTINGCKPYLDFLNDILDAIYSKKEIIIRDFILMQYYSGFIRNYDPLYYREDVEMGLQAHGHTSVPISTFIEHTSTKISREIEKYLIEKYNGTEKEGK